MGRNTPKENRNDEITADQTLIDGLNKNAATIPSIVIDGASVTTKDIVTTLQSRVDTAKAAASARASWLAAVQADRAERDKTKTFVSGLRQALMVAFVGRVDTLAQFGLTPRKARVVSPDQRVAAAAKALATRAARHTMGKKQKAAIKGTVDPTGPAPAVPTLPTPNPTPTAAPAPAPVSPAPVQAAPTASPPAPAPAPVSPAPVQTAPTATPAAPAPSPQSAAPVQTAPTTSPAVPVMPTAPTHGA